MRKESVKKLGEHYHEFVLREPAERNLANKRAKELVAEIYEVPTGKVRQVTGHQSPSKIFELLPDK